MYHSHYLLLIQSILVFPIASDENLGVEARDCRGKAACYTPNFLKFPKISCGFLKRLLKKRKYMEIGNSRKSKEIYGNIMLLPTISIFRFSWWTWCDANSTTVLSDSKYVLARMGHWDPCNNPCWSNRLWEFVPVLQKLLHKLMPMDVAFVYACPSGNIPPLPRVTASIPGTPLPTPGNVLGEYPLDTAATNRALSEIGSDSKFTKRAQAKLTPGEEQFLR